MPVSNICLLRLGRLLGVKIYTGHVLYVSYAATFAYQAGWDHASIYMAAVQAA